MRTLALQRRFAQKPRAVRRFPRLLESAREHEDIPRRRQQRARQELQYQELGHRHLRDPEAVDPLPAAQV